MKPIGACHHKNTGSNLETCGSVEGMAAAGFPKTATINQDVGLPPPRSPSEMPFVNEEWRNDKWAMLKDKFYDPSPTQSAQ